MKNYNFCRWKLFLLIIESIINFDFFRILWVWTYLNSAFLPWSKWFSKELKSDQDNFDLAAYFQQTIEKIIFKKTQVAFAEYIKINGDINKKLVVAGGVAANKCIRKCIEKVTLET